MSRKIQIQKYKDNTHYSVYIIDGYGTEHHLGYSKVLSEAFHKEVNKKAEKIWANEVKPKKDLLSKAILECKEIDSKNPNLRDIL
tara:strand:+ start:243 stop:497 length:255 start_codon:yes stop_codon:yes gene_type:complete